VGLPQVWGSGSHNRSRAGVGIGFEQLSKAGAELAVDDATPKLAAVPFLIQQHPEFGDAGGGAKKDFRSTKPPVCRAGTDYPSVPDAAGR
jgi:hypothetical protein